MKAKNVIAIIVLTIIDQISKLIIDSKLGFGNSITIIDDFFYIHYVRNEGAAFSILQGKRWAFVILTIIALAAMVFYLNKYCKNVIERFAVTLIMAGALGNFIDRILYGYVIDFLDFIIFGYDFPVFNFADCCITVGTIVLIAVVLLTKEEKHDN